MEPLFVARQRDFETTRVKVVAVGATLVAVFRDGDSFHAFKDACPHEGQPLSRGRIADGILFCPGHSWQFELATGRCVKGDTALVLKRYDVVVRDGSVFVQPDS